jgi:hypothetical protein
MYHHQTQVQKNKYSQAYKAGQGSYKQSRYKQIVKEGLRQLDTTEGPPDVGGKV